MGKEVDRKHVTKSIVLPIASCVVIIVSIITMSIFLYHASKSTDPVPKNIREMANFPVYYPDTKKIPFNYKIDESSFSYAQGVVVFAIKYGGTNKVVISEQKQPSAEDIQYFYTYHMPLHITLSTPAGTATIGAIGSQSVTSLPTTDKTWLIITAPSNINQPQLKQLLLAIKSS